jgi:hypothetical protein
MNELEQHYLKYFQLFSVHAPIEMVWHQVWNVVLNFQK